MTPVDAAPTDAITFLEQQHQEVRRLFNLIQQAGPDDKAETFQCLVRLLAAHETAEEEVLHPAARGTDGGNPVVEARLAEESEAKQALADLEKLGVDDPSFDEKLDVFKKSVDLHATKEENEEFPLVRASTTKDSLAEMGNLLRVAEEVAPTHPHPHGPDSALGNLMVGPAVAVADRVRDALRRN